MAQPNPGRELDPALIETDAPPDPMMIGARGRDPGGYPKVIPAGQPPGLAGEPHRLELPKELELPKRPPLAHEMVNITVPALAVTNEILNESLAFPARGLYIDNYSSVWILVYGINRYVPPFSMGWAFSVYKASTQCRVISAAPPGFVQPSLTAGGNIWVTATEVELVYCPGILIGVGPVHP